MNLSVSTTEGAPDTGTYNEGIAYEDVVRVTTNHSVEGLWLEPVYDGKATKDDPKPLWSEQTCLYCSLTKGSQSLSGV